MSSKLQSDVHSGGAIWWMLTGWRSGVVDWGGGIFGRISAAAPLALADQLPLPMIVKPGFVPVRRAI